MGMFTQFKDCKDITKENGTVFRNMFRDLYNSFADKEIRQRVWTVKNLLYIFFGITFILLFIRYGLPLFDKALQYSKYLTAIFLAIAWYGVHKWEKILNQRHEQKKALK